MRLRATLLLLLVSGVWVLRVPATSAAAAAGRSIWIWEEDTYGMLDHEASRRDVFALLDRQRISTLYLYADELHGRNILVNEPQKYQALIAQAHERGWKVYALLGSMYLKTWEYILPEKRETANRMFGAVLTYNAGARRAAEQFDGVNVDVEPYILDDWSTARPRRGRQYLEMSRDFMRMKAEAGSTMQVGPAIPFWFDGIEDVEWEGQRRPLSERVQDLYDYIAIMDYRNFATGSDSIMSHAEDELVYGDQIGRRVMIGVETLKTTPPKVTFFGKGNKYFEEQLALAQTGMAKHSSFGGFVIHHLDSYRTLLASPAQQ